MALDDGSILSVGSDSNLAIAKHDAAQQQTDLDLNYGRVRAKAAKLVKPDAHFQIRTPVGVAGVVGTDMAVLFDANGKMEVFCIEGACKVCDTAGHCVLMKGGQESSVRSNEPPSQPVQATPLNMTEAVNTTATSGAVSYTHLYDAGKPYVYDPFHFTRLVSLNELDSAELVAEIKTFHYGAIQLHGTLPSLERPNERFPDAVLDAIDHYYSLSVQHPNCAIYVPKTNIQN